MTRNEYKRISDDGDAEKASFVSVLFFHWMSGILKTGSDRALEESDFLPLPKEISTSSVTEQLQTKWIEEIANCTQSGKKPKLWKSVMKAFSVKDVLIVIFIDLLDLLCRPLLTLFLGCLISALMSTEPQQRYILYGCAIAMFVNSLVQPFTMHQVFFRCELMGIKLSSAVKGIIYQKVSRTDAVQFTRQPPSQASKQASKQATNQPTDRPTDRPTNQPTNQPIS